MPFPKTWERRRVTVSQGKPKATSVQGERKSFSSTQANLFRLPPSLVQRQRHPSSCHFAPIHRHLCTPSIPRARRGAPAGPSQLRSRASGPSSQDDSADRPETLMLRTLPDSRWMHRSSRVLGSSSTRSTHSSARLGHLANHGEPSVCDRALAARAECLWQRSASLFVRL